MASSSNSSVQKRFKYDVFLSFRGEDTRKNFVDHLYHALKDKGVYTYKDDEKIQKGERISDDLFKSIEDSKFHIIVFSKNYASSSWCLEELVKIMECHKMPGHAAYPVFYNVEPTEVRKQSGAVGKAFAKHEKEVRKKRWAFGLAFFMKKKKAMLKKWKGALKEAADLAFDGHKAKKWKGALKEAAGLAGLELKNTLDGHEAKFIKKIVHEISLELRSIDFGFDEKLVGMETRVKDVVSSLGVGIDEVRMIGIKGMGGAGKTTTARAVFDHLYADFEAICFVENVREVTNASMFGLKKLQEQVLSKVLNEHVTLDSVTDGKNMMKERMCGKKVLLVLDDVDRMEQLKALAGEPKWFKSGSRILITTRDEQVLVAHGVNGIRDIALLSEQEAICLFSRYAFGTENPVHGYEELSGKVVRYAAGLPLTLKVLGSFLCGKDKLEWVDAIDRLEKIPLKDTLEKLELSYINLEDDYQKIFLDIACILKGHTKEDSIRILESCGFHARIGLKVLEQRSLITISKGGYLGMHDHIEEMGKNIVRRSHPDEPNKHSRVWIEDEIEDILANDMGTEETSCLKLNKSTVNAIILMKGFGKMKKLRYLEVNYFASHGPYQKTSDAECLDDTRQYFPNSLKYIKCLYYPFSYLPETFQANNLVGLQIDWSRIVQLWKDGEKKVLKKLKFLSLFVSNLTIFDFRMTPNLETLSLSYSLNLKELCMPASCQKLNYLQISRSKLRTFDLGLTPNLETLYLSGCADFEELHVSVACPNLKFLDLSSSRLRSLDLELIPNLERLDLENCDELVEINAPVGCMKKVIRVDLHGCALLEKLPEDIGRSECLKELDITDTCISHLPQSIFGLKGLHIAASQELLQLYDFPKEIETTTLPFWLKSLRRLYLWGSTIKHLPDSICMLKHLEFLNLNLCALLEKLPEDLGRLECLKELDITGTGISHLPQSISGLKGLLIAASSELLQLYDFPSEIKTTTSSIRSLSEQEAISLFSRYAFGRENPLQGYEELSRRVVLYAAGLPLTVKVLGSFLCGKDKDEWKDAIERLKEIPLKETQEKLELSYTSLEKDYKEIFLDIACIMKGQTKEDAIRVLECCGFHATNGLKVLEQRSLITVDEDGELGMHNRIEEMGKNIVCREDPEEIEDILANDMGTQATRCLKLTESNRNARIVMKGLGRMKCIRILELNFADYDADWLDWLDDTSQYFSNSLRYLKCTNYPFLYLPKTFQANNLVGLEMECSRRMVQLWEEGEKKVLNKLKFLSLSWSNLTIFDLRITPNLETLSLNYSLNLKELCMPASCQKLNYLQISRSKLKTFDLGLTLNLETLSLFCCADFVELYVSVACPNLKFLNLSSSRSRSLDLELIPNLESLDLRRCHELVEINAPVGCLKKVVRLNLSGCELLEKLPEDIGRSECLKELDITDTGISHLPQSIFELKGLIIAARQELLELYDFPSEIETTSSTLDWY